MGHKKKKTTLAIFHGRGLTASRLEPLQGGNLLFTIKFLEIPGTHLIDLGRMKAWVDLRATQWFWTRDPGVGIQHLIHQTTAPSAKIPKTRFFIITSFMVTFSSKVVSIKSIFSTNLSFINPYTMHFSLKSLKKWQ